MSVPPSSGSGSRLILRPCRPLVGITWERTNLAWAKWIAPVGKGPWPDDWHHPFGRRCRWCLKLRQEACVAQNSTETMTATHGVPSFLIRFMQDSTRDRRFSGALWSPLNRRGEYLWPSRAGSEWMVVPFGRMAGWARSRESEAV